MCIRDRGITVVMDTNLTPELIEEGFVREIVSKIQTMRKDAGFEVMDKITVYVDGNDKLADLMVKNAEQIKSVVLANTIETGKTAGFTKDWDKMCIRDRLKTVGLDTVGEKKTKHYSLGMKQRLGTVSYTHLG